MTATADRFACDARFPGHEAVRLMRAEIQRTRLDLKGLRVLTEAAVGYRRVTPVLAALAGADEVYAVGRDSVHASRREAEEQTAWLATLARVETKVKVLSTRLQAPLAEVDVVTDLPGVRPVDEAIVRNLADTAAVSLMRGVAAWRAGDVDVATCRRHGVAVAGVDEEAVGLYRSFPMAVVADLLELGVDAGEATLVVAGDGPAYPYVVTALARLGARVLVAAPESAGRIGLYGGSKAGSSIGDESVLGRLAEADALVLCHGPADARWIGPGAAVDAARLAAAAPHLAVTGIGAESDLKALEAAGLRCRAAAAADPVEYLLRPVIALHAAGLKVAESMTRARRRGSSPLAAEQVAVADAHAEALPKDLAPRR